MALTRLGERSVSLVLRVKRGGKWTRVPAVYGKNGRIRPGFGEVDGKQVQFEAPAYELRTYENRQAKYIPAGRNASDAEAERIRREHAFRALAIADKAGLKIEVPKEERLTLRKSASAYIQDCVDRGADEAAGKARLVTEEFIRTVKKVYVDEICRADVLTFHKALRKRDCSERTIFDKHNRIKSWFLHAGIKSDALKALLPPAPKFDKKLPTTYSRDDLSSILAAADPREHLIYTIALKCGLRDQELCHLEFTDINHERRVLRVQSKPAYDFRVKDAEERDIPVPDDVLKEIREWKELSSGNLMFPAPRGGVDRKMLRTLKRLAKREKLNCGQCDGCKSRLGECQSWTLHKFRRSYATTLLQNGIDLKTVQAYMGHSDLESTLRYLRPAESNGARDKLNAIQW